MRALLVLNEKARRGLQDAARVCELLEACGIECVRDVIERNVDAVIAAGGDGTVTWSIPAALERHVPLGIVPLGTFNDLARTLGIPLDLSQACRAIAEGHTKRIDVGRVNDKYFVNESSVGVSTRIARRQTPEVKQRFGALGVAGTTLQSILETRPFFVELAYDGQVEQFRSVQLTIANNKHFGGVIDRPDAAIDDGWLDLYSVEARTWWQFFALVRKIVSRDPSSGEGLRTRRAARFDVRTHHAHHIEADGEPAGFTPATFEVLPLALEVLVPRALS
jgi:YegS/Rv2252/BmrU family lipid kinase